MKAESKTYEIASIPVILFFQHISLKQFNLVVSNARSRANFHQLIHGDGIHQLGDLEQLPQSTSASAGIMPISTS